LSNGQGPALQAEQPRTLRSRLVERADFGVGVAQAEGQRPGRAGRRFQGPPADAPSTTRNFVREITNRSVGVVATALRRAPAPVEKGDSRKISPGQTRRRLWYLPPPAAGRCAQFPGGSGRALRPHRRLGRIVSPAAQARSPIHGASAASVWSASNPRNSSICASDERKLPRPPDRRARRQRIRSRPLEGVVEVAKIAHVPSSHDAHLRENRPGDPAPSAGSRQPAEEEKNRHAL